MSHDPLSPPPPPGEFHSLIRLFQQMDDRYALVADRYGFSCDQCTDNCCRSLFYHHTFIEKAYLRYGCLTLSAGEKVEIRRAARSYVTQTTRQPGSSPPDALKPICPVNKNGRCGVYAFRPMICRLHGLPHELQRPDGTRLTGPGCAHGQFEDHPYIPFDRTRFYTEMARIEREFRFHTRATGKIRETVAHMLVDLPV